MRKLNLIVVFNNDLEKVLFCIRAKEPYKGLYNFVGGRMEISALFAGLYGLCGKRGRECRRNIGLFEAYRIG